MKQILRLRSGLLTMTMQRTNKKSVEDGWNAKLPAPMKVYNANASIAKRNFFAARILVADDQE